MRLVARRSLALFSILAAIALVSCSTGRAPVHSKLAPDNAVYNLETEGLKRLWSQELGQLTDNRRLKDIYSAGSFVVVEAHNGEIHCLDAASGVWRGTTVLRDELRVPPTAVGNKLVFVVNNDLVTFDVAADRTERPVLLEFAMTTQPLLYGDSLYLAGGDGKVERLRLSEKTPEWLASLRGAIFDQPVVAGGCLLATSANGVLMWDLAAGAERARWSPKAPARITSGAAGIGGRFYVGDSRGILYALQGDTGQPTWQRMLGAPIRGRLTPVGSDLLLLTGKPDLICLNATGERGVRWRQDGVVEVLAIGKATVYALKADGVVAAIDMETGEQRWCDPVPANCKVTGDDNSPTIYIANPKGSVVALTELD